MELSDYAEIKIEFILGNDHLTAIERNPEVGYIVSKDVGEILAKLAVNLGYPIGDKVSYNIFIKKRTNSS